MKTALIITALLALALIHPGSREGIVRFASGIWNRTFSTVQERSTISAEARKEEMLRRSQLQAPAPKPNALRAVSDELKGLRAQPAGKKSVY